MKINFLISLFLILFLIVLFFFFIKYVLLLKYEYIYEDFENSMKMSYYRCNEKELGKITKNIFDSQSIYKSNDEWDIYVPCGYNDIEEELAQILIKKNIQDKYIFGINGCDTIVSKNKIWESLLNCNGREHASRLMPESFVLEDDDEMKLFEKKFDPFQNQIYILKKNIQRKEGLKLTRNYQDIMEAKKDDYKVVQKYITNLYLINQRKVNLRIYLLVVIKDHTIYFYMCKNGKCIYTNKKYNDNDLDFESNITSYHLDMNVYTENPRTLDELKEYITKDLNEHNATTLFYRIELLMKEVSMCLSKNLYQSRNIKGSISFQLFGADVIIDNDLHPYLLELNKGPDMSPRDEIDEQMKTAVQNDMFKILNIIKDEKKSDNSFLLVYQNRAKQI